MSAYKSDSVPQVFESIYTGQIYNVLVRVRPPTPKPFPCFRAILKKALRRCVNQRVQISAKNIWETAMRLYPSYTVHNTSTSDESFSMHRLK